MRKLPIIVVAIIVVLVAASCDGPNSHHRSRMHSHGSDRRDFKPGDGAIDLDHGDVVIRAGGTGKNARVGVDGSLSIGDKVVDTNADGRTALQTYNADAVAIEDHGIAIGKAGMRFGMATMKEVLHGIANGTADEAGRHADEGATQLEASVHDLCGRLEGMYKAQETAASNIPEFKPYAVIASHQVTDCIEGTDEKDRHGRSRHQDRDRDRDDSDDEDDDGDKSRDKAG